MRLFSFAFALLAVSTVFAQKTTKVVSDEELKKYAVVMDSVDRMSNSLLETISELVKNNDQVTAARYNDLNKILDDETKLKEEEATPEEVIAIKEIVKKKEEGTAHIQATFLTMAKEYIGAAEYNKIKKAITSDPATKSRYEAILASLTKKEETN